MSTALHSTAQGNLQPFTVVIDAAHGGNEPGTTFAPGLFEKDLVLTLSIHLRSVLNARGIRVVTTRENDSEPTPETRTAEANHARAGACLVLHATASGSGVHLYTSSQSLSTKATQGPAPWSTAGAPFGTASLQLASEISSALGAAGIPFTLGRVRLEPLDNLRCPAVAVEIAPLRRAGSSIAAPVSDSAYQARVVNALAAGLMEWRSEREGAGDEHQR